MAKKKRKKHPPGHIGVATGFLGRYREFDAALERTLAPSGSQHVYHMGVDVCSNYNGMVDATLSDPKLKWLWILGDDHLWSEDLLMCLLDRDVDVVTPLCCRRTAPFEPVMHETQRKGFGYFKPDPYGFLKGKSGILEWKGTSGNAGMLIRRHVLEEIKFPWFENGKTNPGVGGSDIYFWHKLQRAGFKTYLDLDNVIGHITHACVWPRRDDKTGEWSYLFRSP